MIPAIARRRRDRTPESPFSRVSPEVPRRRANAQVCPWRILSALFVMVLCSIPVRAADSGSRNNRDGPIPIAGLKRSSPVDFSGEVLPLLKNSCLACHNRTTAKARLILETPADMLKGGDSGPAVEPGHSTSSLVLKAAAHQLEDTIMPPPGNKAQASDLTSEELALLKLWIDQGAIPSKTSRPELEWQTLPKELNAIYAVALTRDGQFAACGRGNQVFLYHLPTGRIVTRLIDPPSAGGPPPGAAHRDLVQSLAFNPDGTLLASGAYREIKLWERPSNPQILHIAPAAREPITSLATSPDGRWFATGAADGRIRLWSLPSGKAVKTLSRHSRVIAGLTFSPDSLLLCSGSSDKTLQVWSVPDGQSIARAETPAEIAAVSWLASGRQIASGGIDRLIRIWEFSRSLRSLSGVSELRGHQGPVTALATAPANPDHILSGSADGTIRLWDVHARSQVLELKHGGAVTSVAIRPDGRRFASTGLDRASRLWDAGDGRLIAELKGDPGSREDAAELERLNGFLKAEILFHQAVRKSAETNQTAQTERVRKANEADAVAARELPEKQKLLADAITARTAAEKAVDDIKAELNKFVESSNQVARTSQPAGANSGATASVSGSEAGTTGGKAAIELKEREKHAAEKLKTAAKVFNDAETGLKKAGQNCTNARTELELAQKALAEAGRSVVGAMAALQEAESAERESDAAWKSARLRAAQFDLPVRAVDFSPDNRTLATAGDDRLVHISNADNGTPFESFRGHVDSILAASFAPDGTLITAGADRSVELWNPDAPWTLARRLGTGSQDSPLADRVNALRFSPDGQQLAAGGGEPTRGGEITLWDPATGRLLRNFTNVHSDAVFALDFTRDGKRLATAAADRFAKVIDLQSGKVVKQLEGHTHHVLGVGWKRDGRTLATASADNLIKIWEFPTGDRKKNITGFDKEVTSVGFVGYTDQALATSGDGRVRLVREDGTEVRSFSGNTDYVYSAASTPDGRLVIAGGQDGILRVWNASDGRLISSFPPPENK